jgi:uncharacterized protein YciI
MPCAAGATERKMDRLSDDVIKQIAAGSGRCYAHEGKKMAQEILERRAAEAAARTAASAPLTIAPPWGTLGNTP